MSACRLFDASSVNTSRLATTLTEPGAQRPFQSRPVTPRFWGALGCACWAIGLVGGFVLVAWHDLVQRRAERA